MVECSVMVLWVIRSIPHAGSIHCFFIPPLFHDWCNKGHGMYYPVCEMVHIKDPLLLIEKDISNPVIVNNILICLVTCQNSHLLI